MDVAAKVGTHTEEGALQTLGWSFAAGFRLIHLTGTKRERGEADAVVLHGGLSVIVACKVAPAHSPYKN